MTHYIGNEADHQPLHLNPVQSTADDGRGIVPYPDDFNDQSESQPNLETQELLNRVTEFLDEYSVVESDHIDVADFQEPNSNPFRWCASGVREPQVIIDKSGKFGPMRIVELKVDLIDEYHCDFHIEKVHTLKWASEDCLEQVRRETEVEGLTVRLFRGDIFTNSQFESMACLIDSDVDWEERPEFALFSLVQYWVFHHQKAFHLLRLKERDYA